MNVDLSSTARACLTDMKPFHLNSSFSFITSSKWYPLQQFNLSSWQVGEVHRSVEVVVRRQSLLARATSAKDHIPNLRLLAIVGRLPVSLAMVHIVVLDQQLCVDHPEERSVRRWRTTEDACARVSDKLSEDHVRLAKPELIKAHREAENLHGGIGEQRDDDDVEGFLFVVGEEGEKRRGVLGQVVGAVELPETVDFVHGAVVPVEPEVQADGVHSNLGDDPP